MSQYQHTTTGEIREIAPELMAAWLAAGNPKADGWTAYTPPAPALATIKAAQIAGINAECQARIVAVWPLERQISATLGIYGPATLEEMTAFIDAHIEASNAASDAVDAAANQRAVEAVTVAWPV